MWIFNASPWSPRVLSILRIIAGFLFFLSGSMKLFGFPEGATPIQPVPLWSEMGIAGILETFGGLAVLLGVLTRPIAFVLSGEMAVAYFQAHAPRSFFPNLNDGVPAVLYCFLFLYFAFAGAGEWSIDALFARRRGHRSPPVSTRLAEAR